MDIRNVEPKISHEMSVEKGPLYPGRPRTLYPLRVTSRIFTIAGVAAVFYAVMLIAVAVESTIIEF
jgi:hypothetical protein